MTELAVRWAKCAVGKRKKYQILADKAKEQYDQDIQTWKTNKNSKQYDFIPNEKKSGPVSMKTSKLSKALTANLNNNEEPGLRV